MNAQFVRSARCYLLHRSFDKDFAERQGDRLRQRKPIDWLVAIVTRVCSDSQANLCSGASHLGHVLDVSNNHVRTVTRSGALGRLCVASLA